MKHFKLFFACMLMLLFGFGQVWADTPAAAGTTLFSEDFSSYANTDVPNGSVTTATGRVVYGGVNVTYTSTDGAGSSAGTTKVTTDNSGNLAGGTSPELMVGKKGSGTGAAGGSFSIAGIPSGGAQAITVVYKQNKQNLSVSVSGTGYSTTFTGGKPDAAGERTFDITVEDGADATFTLTLQAAATSNVRVDDILITVKTAGEGAGTPKTLTGVAVSGTPTKTVYNTGENFDPTGLTVTGTYSDASTAPISSGITWAYTPSQTLALNQTSIGVTATVSEITSAEYNVTGLTVSDPVVSSWQVIAPADLVTGDMVVLTMLKNAVYYAAPNNGGSSAPTATAVTVVGDKLSNEPAATLQWEVTVVSAGVYQFSVGENYLKCTDTNNGVKVGTGDYNTFNVVEENEKFYLHTTETMTSAASGRYLGIYNTQDWRCYSSVNNNIKDGSLVIFKDASAAATVAKPTISGDENFVGSTTVTITHADADHIYYTTDGTDPTTSSTLYEGSFSLNATATVKAIAVKGSDESQVAEKTFTKGTKLSVAAAIALIPNNNDTQDNQFVEGYVCTAGTSVSSGQMTYYISDDGTETNRLQIFKGKNLNNTNFTAITDLSLQDKVVVFGQLKNYSGTPEMNSGNYIVERVAATVATPTFTPDGGGFLTTQSVTLACTTDGAEIRYTTDGSDPTELSTLYSDPIELSATTTITAAAFKGGASSSAVARTFTKGTKITVADALLALESNDPIENQFVYGKVSTASTGLYSGKLTYYISDDGSTTNQLEVYNGYGLNGAVFTDKTDLQVGDEVTVYGTLTIHNTTKEFAAGSYLLEFNRPTVDLNSITLPATANVKVGKTVTLTPTFNPTNATDKTVSWTSDDELIATVVDGVVTGVAAGTVDITVTYTADPTIKATCAVTVSEAPSFDDPTYEWQLVTSDAQLVAGKYYVIASDTKGKVASAISSDVLGTETAVFADGAIAYNAFGDSKTADASDAIVFELGGTSSAWTLTEVVDGSGLLGYKADKKVKWGGDATTWTISIADNNATIVPIDANTYHILYNVGSPRFTVYASDPTVSMLLPQLYVWTLKTYKLRYDANGGEDAPATQAADGEGKATVTTAIPTAPTDKIFERWNTQNDGLGTDKAAGDVIDLSSADVTLYAIWRDPVDNITISYDANGGEGSIDADADQVEGTQYTIKANAFTREGYSFAGWKAYDASDNELTITSNKITVPSTNVTIKAQWGELTVTDFVLVTNVNQLQDGDKVYIVAAGDRNFAAGALDGSILSKLDIQKTVDKEYLVLPDGATEPVEYTVGISGDQLTLQNGTQYLYSTSVKNMGLRNDAFSWTVSITAEGVATLHCTVGDLKYNASAPRFTTYGSGQQDISLYKKANYTRAATEGRYGTICLPNGGIMHGAEIYEIAYYGGASQKIFMDEIPSGEMVAGTPYIFLPKEGTTKLAVVYTDAANAPAGSHNGLIGSYAKEQIAANAGNYILLNNQYCLVESTVDPVYVGENKAYIKMSDITPVAPALKPGAKRVGLGVAAPQTPTGCENLDASETPVKVMINGQMYIIRGEKMYNANGQLVK